MPPESGLYIQAGRLVSARSPGKDMGPRLASAKGHENCGSLGMVQAAPSIPDSSRDSPLGSSF